MEDFLSKLAKVMVIDRSELNSDSALCQLDDWDSLARLSAMVMVEETYGVTLSSDAISSVQTPAELFAAIESSK
jgi:acyl carrier protein